MRFRQDTHRGAGTEPLEGSRVALHFRRCSEIASASIVMFGVLVLAGWLFDISLFKRVHPSLVAMKANAAALFVLLGFGLRFAPLDRSRRVRRAIGMLILIFAALTLAQHVLGVHFGIDELLFRDATTDNIGPPGRMAPATALSFVLLGLALVLLDSRAHRISSVAAVMATFVSLIGICGYLYETKSLYALGAYSSMAVHTALGFLLSCGAFFFARPTEGFMALLANDRVSGSLLRRLLPAVVFIPIGLGWIRLRGQAAGLYDTHFGVALQVLSTISMLAGLAWLIALSLDRSEVVRLRIHEQLVEGEERMRLAQQVARIGTFEWDLSTGVNLWTPELEAMYGLPPGGFARTQDAWEKLVHPEDRAEAKRSVALAVETGAPTEGEWRVVWPDGSVHWIAGRFQAFLDATGAHLRLTGANIDITEQKRAEAERERLLVEVQDLSRNLEQRVEERTRELALARDRLDGIISVAADAIISIDTDQRITIFNKGAEDVFGWTRDEVLGQPLDILLPERMWSVHRENIAKFAAEPTKARRMAERRAVYGRRKGGEEFPAEAAISKLRTDKEYFSTVILRDVSPRLRLEADLLESRNFLQNVLESSTEYAIIAEDLERRVQMWNTGAQRLYGYAPPEIVGKQADILHASEDGLEGRVDALHREALEKGTAACLLRGRREDGAEFLSRAVITRRADALGTPIGYLLISRDVSLEEKYLAEQSFFAQVSAILASTLDCEDMARHVAGASVPFLCDLCEVLIVQDQRKRCAASCARQELASAVEAPGRAPLRDHGSGLLWRTVESMKSVLLSELPADALEGIADGEEDLRWFRELGPSSVMAVPLLAHGRCHGAICFTSRDTHRRYGPSELRLAEEVGRRFALAVDNALLYEERRLQATIATHLSDGIYLIRASDGIIIYANPRFKEMFGYTGGGLIGEHVSIVNAPGDRSPKELAEEIHVELRATGRWQGEIENIKKDGTRFWCHASVSTFEHPQFGTVWISVHADITERKRLEAERARAFKEREILLKEIHHRVKNNLQVISSLFYLQGQRTEEESIRRLLDESRSRIQSIALIHEKLYQSEHLAWIDFGDYLRDLMPSLIGAIGSHAPRATIEVQADDVLLDIEHAIPCALLTNELVSNALKHAFPGGREGTIRVSIGPVDSSSLKLEVSDTGVGFPAEIDFRKTATLGMQLVVGLTKQLGGTVDIVREGGTRVVVRFPRGSPA